MAWIDPAGEAPLRRISARREGQEVRAFFAIALPAAAREACTRLARSLAASPNGNAVRWVRPEGFHLTLRFLGNVEVERMASLAEAASDALAVCDAFELTLGAPMLFPSTRRPRVVALPAEPEPVLAALAGRLETVAVASGLAPEPRAFRAHLTLGRLRGRRVPSLEGVSAPEPGRVPVDSVALFRSDLERDGARYTALAQFSLIGEGGAPPPADSP